MSPALAPALVVCGPSGVGKGTVIARARQLRPEIWLSVSATTRAPREGERDGVDYFFVTSARFSEMVDSGGMLEWAQYAGNRYGTPAEPVREHREAGRPSILEIEVQGARQVRASLPDAMQVFISPPTRADLERRLRGRGTDPEEQVRRRLRRAEEELDAMGEFDEVLVNHDVERTAAALVALSDRAQGSP